MIVHILPDDKFVTTFYNMAVQAIPDGVEQLFLVRDPLPYKHLPTDVPSIVNGEVGTAEFNKVVDSLGKGDRIIIHFITGPLRKWLSQTKTQASIEWVVWSSDFYYSMYWRYPHYDKLTFDYVYDNKPLSKFFLLNYYRQYQKQKRIKANGQRFLQERDAAASKINRIFHYIKEEYELIMHSMPIKASFNYFSYRQAITFAEMLERFGGQGIDTTGGGLPRLLVGHSGFPHANHLDLFELLKPYRGQMELIVPLSYGEEPYITHIVKEGERLFGQHFKPILNFIPLEVYLQTLLSCKGAIFGMNECKGMANIHTCLIFGKRVFIKQNMMTSKYFERIGVKTDALEHFSLELLNTPLDAQEIESNRNVLLEIHSKENKFQYVQNMLSLK